MSDEDPAPIRTQRTRRVGLRATESGPAAAATRGELLLAFVLALVMAAGVIGQPLVDGTRVFFALDTGTAASPWSTAGRSNAEVPDRGARSSGPAELVAPIEATDLADSSGQGAVLYPAYRFTLEELAARRVPTWNPYIATGLPWLANPRWGVLDPRVGALAVLESIGGRAFSDRGLAWLAWLGLTSAAFGAYVLARRLGLRASGAAVCAAGFAGASVCLAWINAPVGHVATVLPWLFVALDRVRAHTRLRSIAWVAFATALVVLGGHPEAAFFGGLAGFLFAGFTLEGRARTYALLGLALGTLLCAPVLLPFVEYLRHSAVLVDRAAEQAAHARFDFVALGMVTVTIAIVVAWRGLDTQALGAARSAAGMVGVVIALCTCAFVLGDRGASHAGRTFLLFDALGSPASGGWRGSGAFLEAAIAWVPGGILALSLASFFAPGGPLRQRSFCQALAVGALLLSIGAPGVLDLWRRLPFFGLCATAGAAGVSALCLSLLAGEALDAAPRAARRAAALAFVALVSIALLARPPAPPRFDPDPAEEYFACTARPDAVWTAGEARIAGFIANTLPCDQLELRIERLDEDGRAQRTGATSSPLDLTADDAAGRRTFQSASFHCAQFTSGTWRFALDLFVRDTDGRLQLRGSRDVAYTHVALEPQILPMSMLFTMLSFLSVLFLAGMRSRSAWIVPAIVAGHALFFARGLLPAVPLERQFHETKTELALRADASLGRAQGGSGVLPGNTALLSRIQCVGGDDGIGLESFEKFRRATLKSGSSPRLAWNADGIDPESAAFRLLGVSTLAFSTRVDPSGFDLIAGPDADCARQAETFVYRAREPMPRAFTVSSIAERGFAGAEPQSFDPRREAFLDVGETWRPASPGGTSKVEITSYETDRVVLAAEVGGDALLVLTDAAYPGWVARVDGVPTRILTVDALFRGVPLTRGARRVEFSYEPFSLALGAWIGLVSFIALWILAVVPSRR